MESKSKNSIIPNAHNSPHTSHLSALTSQNGITLIALVVTIIVLLILAGVTIMSLLSEDGIFEKAERAEYETRKARFEERIGLVNLDAQTQKALNGNLTAEDYFEIVKDNGLISDSTIGGDNIEDKGENTEGDHVYEVTTEDGDVFEVIIDDEGNVETEYQGTADGLPPRISGIETSKTTNSITVKVIVSRLEGGEIKYYIKKASEEKYPDEAEETSKDTSYTFEGLEQNVIYDIKVVVENSKGRDEYETSEITGELATGAITQKGETVWSNGQASIELETTETEYTIQYKVGENGQWQEYKGAITGLHHNDKVYVRLWDGINGSGETAITITDGIKPTVNVTTGTQTTSSIQVNVSSRDDQSGMPASPTYSYYIKTTGQGDYPQQATYTTTDTSYTFSGLTQNTTYDIKVEVADNAGNAGEGSSSGTTTGVGGAEEGLKQGNITVGETTWSNNKASITLSTSTNFMIQYKVGSSGTWTPASYSSSATGKDVTVTGLTHNTIVYARLLDDANNAGSQASVTIQDGIAPSKPTITLSSTSTTIGASITATVTHTDNQSGVAIANCKYIYNTTSGTLGTTHSSWNSATSFSSNPQPITLTASTPGTYYLHVLTVDNAGNKAENVSQAITVRQLVTGITLNRTSATITEGETLQLTATVSPSNASNKAVTWSSSSNSIASVNTNGLVTAKTAGTATITVTTQDGSNKKATCRVTVNKKPATNVNELEAGDYVNYVDGTGVTRKCAVLYDSSSPYGVEIITMDTVEDVTLGDDDNFNTSMNSHNNAISTLNNATSKYINTTYADESRSVGSVPDNINNQSGYYTFTIFSSSYSGKLRDEDDNYLTDWNQMKNLGIHSINDDYFLNSRSVTERYVNSSVFLADVLFGVRYVSSRGILYSEMGLCYMAENGDINENSYTCGLRPVFHLKSGIKVTSGSGTSSNPYTLGT